MIKWFIWIHICCTIKERRLYYQDISIVGSEQSYGPILFVKCGGDPLLLLITIGTML